MKAILEIDENGDVHCLYTDEIDLFAIGTLCDMRKASNVDFNEEKQTWEVVSLDRQVLHSNTNREKAIEWEIWAFSPTGQHYHG